MAAETTMQGLQIRCIATFVHLPYKFTGKERDTESGNDYFGARYYASSMGRFMSPDWSAQAEPVPYAKLDDPQTLNLYSYERNNPLSGADPDGHCDWCQKLLNGLAGYGYVTNDERDARIAEQRQWLIDHSSDDKTKDYWKNVSGKKVFEGYVCSQSSSCLQNAIDSFKVQNGLPATGTSKPEPFGPESLQRDATGRIHTSLPDRIPDNWSRAQLEEARDELQQSIKARIQQAADHGGADTSHMARIRHEQQLLRQIEDKLGSK